MDRRRWVNGASDADRCEELVLWVRLTPGERFTGIVGQSTRCLSHPFSGWIDFMGAVNTLRASQSGPGSK